MEPDEVRVAFSKEHGYWNSTLQELLDADPEFFAAYAELTGVPRRHGALDAKVRDLLAIAVDAAVTHLYGRGLRVHVRNALAHGATPDEIMETFQLVAVLGIHAVTAGVPLLAESRATRDPRENTAVEDPRRDETKAEFIRIRGYWDSTWDDLLTLDPDFFKAYLDFSSVPWLRGVLEPKVKELIYIAIDASATHMYAGGLRVHIGNAVGHGATTAEIMEVLEIASVIGMQTLEVGVPILLEEVERLRESRT